MKREKPPEPHYVWAGAYIRKTGEIVRGAPRPTPEQAARNLERAYSHLGYKARFWPEPSGEEKADVESNVPSRE
ncbi:MAG: hypothetical protein LBB86_01210 [Oscillospiraceae bacterium]|jgi:hypothetical protein|nr:hypothetical protein [Oscillospiraceae bacterium]